jgi:hypothetical protein
MALSLSSLTEVSPIAVRNFLTHSVLTSTRLRHASHSSRCRRRDWSSRLEPSSDESSTSTSLRQSILAGPEGFSEGDVTSRQDILAICPIPWPLTASLTRGSIAAISEYDPQVLASPELSKVARPARCAGLLPRHSPRSEWFPLTSHLVGSVADSHDSN